MTIVTILIPLLTTALAFYGGYLFIQAYPATDEIAMWVIPLAIPASAVIAWLLSIVIRLGMARNAREHGATPDDIKSNYGEWYERRTK